MKPNDRRRRPIRKKSLRPGGNAPAPPRRLVEEIVQQAVADGDAEILELSLTEHRVLRVVIDREARPVDTQLLTSLVRGIRKGLRDADVDPGTFSIEFDSPGERRLLTTARHFDRFRGEAVRVAWRTPVDGRSSSRFVLVGADGHAPRVRDEAGHERTLAPHEIESIRLEPSKR